MVRNLGVSFDDQLAFKEHIAKTARSCRFALHNIRKIRPFLIEYAAQLLVQALVISRMDYSSALLAGLQSNLYKWFRMQRHDWSSTNPKEAMLHLSLPSSTGYQLQLASSSRHWCLHIEQPQAQHPPTSTHRSLRSASERRLVVPSQRGSKSLSRTFSFTIPGRWNDLPTPIRNAGSLSIFKQ